MFPLTIGRFDNNIITGAANTSELIVILGRYPFDKNPYIGKMADINVWSRYVGSTYNVVATDVSIAAHDYIAQDDV